jgi:3-oxoacyl-[acyl-carrier-protein] synthase II
VDPERLGVVVSSGIGGIASTLVAYDTLKDKGWQRLSPYTVPMLMPNGSAGWIAIELNARAGVHTTVSACASGAEAIGYAIDMIRAGRADIVLAGGTEAAILPLNIAAFAAMRALSTRNDEPQRASRPFDKGRDGFLLGEGAGMVVLESAEHAARRGATVYAIAAGVGYSSDAHHIAQPDPAGTGIVRAIERVLTDAQLVPEQIVHVNAHATSTPAGDVVEGQAIATALGPAAAGVVVSATKSMTGHLLGGAGALESVATILALQNRVAPPRPPTPGPSRRRPRLPPSPAIRKSGSRPCSTPGHCTCSRSMTRAGRWPPPGASTECLRSRSPAIHESRAVPWAAQAARRSSLPTTRP